FRSTYFLQQAKGPFAEQFYGLIPDRFGMDRLDQARVNDQWTQFSQTARTQLKLNEAQQAEAEEILKGYLQRLKQFFAQDADEIRKHRLEVRRLTDARRQQDAAVETQQAWITSRDLELQAAAKPWIANIEAMQAGLQRELMALAPEQASAVRPLPNLSAKSWVDHTVTYVTIGVGVCLLLGFCTSFASLIGAGFLCSVLLTQPFWVPDANLMVFPYQLVEVSALLFLAAISAGRYAGLDYFWWAYRNRAQFVD
ncbi:MAG: hypothetical protein AAGF97_08470, partial [Planctomycetota bacterium]